ncbi:MAG TPA: hypothetical protein VMV49_03630 [Candidatus Deferrimicrobium sp.]|nr:hypothetical protein [Candidatus Deferrimicrobium sp.]
MDKITTLLKGYVYIALVINGIAIILNIIAVLGLKSLQSMNTIVFFITFGINLGLIYLNLDFINRADSTAQKLKNICRIYLAFLLLAVLVLFSYSIIYSFIEVGNFLRLIAYIGLYIAYYGTFGIGLFIGFLDFQNINNSKVWKV